MPCPALESLSSAMAAVEALPLVDGLGAGAILTEQVQALAGALARLQRELAVRMAALERAEPLASDVRGHVVRAGVDARRAQLLRRVGVFAEARPEVERAWRSGSIRLEQVDIVRAGTGKVSGHQRGELVREVLPLLEGLDAKATEHLVAFAVDHLTPGDPDHEEVCDHAARRMAWSRVAGGGLTFEGYLPPAEGAAFTAAVDALVESLRVAGDGLTAGQRRADALATLVATAGQNGLPAGGGLPAAMTLTVSLTEASRVALRDPGTFASRIRIRSRSSSTVEGQHAGDATVRFGVCCAAVTPVLTDQPGDQPGDQPRDLGPATERRTLGSLLDRLARTAAQPLAVGRSVRLATPAQRHALRVRDGGCAIPGCDIDAAYTQPHHVVGWALGGSTDLDSLVSLCWVHHRLTELGRFRFITRKDGESPPRGSLEHHRWWILPPASSAS